MSAAPIAGVQLDVVIVGASVTGSAVATLLREHGLSVCVVDARNRCAVGKSRRETLMPVWALEDSRLPVGEVIRVPSRLHLFAGRARRTLATPDCVLVEPGALVDALLTRAIAMGATFIEGHRVTRVAPASDGVILDDGRIFHAKFVIDASGVDGLALLGERAVEPCEIASIAHETRRITDRRLADAYLEAASVDRGEGVVFLAPCGPGSLVVTRVDEDARTLSFDAVTFADGVSGVRPTARAAIRRVANGFSWIGETTSEDARHVALGGLRATLASGNLALVGGAAGMTRPGFGADDAFGIVSARVLADCLASDGDLSRYDRCVRARFEDAARVDAMLARFFRSLDEDDLAAMLDSGAIGEGLVSGLLEQRAARLPALRFAGAAALRAGRASMARAMSRALDPAPAFQLLRALGVNG